MKYDANSIPEYLSVIPPERKPQLETIIQLIKEVAPAVDEVFEYCMPFYPLKGKPLFAVASQKHFMALYITEHDLVAQHKDDLGKISLGKSCLRFTKIEKLNLEALEVLLSECYTRRMSELDS